MKAEDIDDYEDLLDDAEDHAESVWENDFVADMRDRYEQYGDSTFVSYEQLDKLREIAEK